MPYIDPKRRRFVRQNGPETPGELNYLICYHANELYKKLGGDYHARSHVRAAITDASDEFYRRVMAQYEDEKCKQNGDVFT